MVAVTTMIKLQNITKYYGETLAVDNLSFEIQPGEIVGFLGPNGAGKTTTMRILTGFLSPTKGSASVCGFDIQEDSLEVRKRVGYLPEMNPVYDEMCITEYLSFIAEIRKIPLEKIHLRLKEVIEICGLKDVLHQNIGELSRGYRQRVGFASTIFHDPEVLIMDEPTTGLDPNQAREVRQLVKELKKEKTVILSTHILSEVQAVCDRVLIINNGQLVADGTSSDLQSMVHGKEKIHLEIKTESLKSPESAIEILKELSGCESVLIKEKNSKVWFEISALCDIREEIFQTAIKNNWSVIELHRETITLEEIFRQLTT